MPSNFTPNYSLNQWEASDKVQRVDFNADNAKIDAALAGKLGRPELIYKNEDIPFYGAIDAMFYKVDWTPWSYAILHHRIHVGDHQATTLHLGLRPGGEIFNGAVSSATVIFPIYRDVTRPLQGILMTKEIKHFHFSQYTFQQLVDYQVRTNSSVPGLTTTVYGIR